MPMHPPHQVFVAGPFLECIDVHVGLARDDEFYGGQAADGF